MSLGVRAVTAERPSHRRGPRRPRRRVALGVLSLIIVAVVGWVGVTLGATWARSDGEPTSVIVATWMRDNHMGPLVAQLEDIYYAYIDTPDVGGSPTVSADLTAEDTAGLDVVAETEAVEEIEVPPTTTSVPLLLAPVERRPPANSTAPPEPSASPELTASPAPKGSSAPFLTAPRAHLDPPPTLVSPADEPEPKEGVWQPVASRVDGVPAIYVTRVRADNVHTSYYASVMWIDTLLTRAMFVPGYEEPGGPNPFDGALPREFWSEVLANINGGFRLDDTRGGYYYDGEMVRPLVKGRASAVVYRDGTITVGRWGRDLEMSEDVVAVRQNLDLIVDRGTSQVSNGADNVVWGATTDKESLAWRAALGERADGSLVYVGSPYLSAESLADVLVSAGVRRAMVLDMNDWWAAGFYFRHKKDGTPLCRKLDPSISGGCDRFLQPYKRDSFQFLVRPAGSDTPAAPAPGDYSSTMP